MLQTSTTTQGGTKAPSLTSIRQETQSIIAKLKSIKPPPASSKPAPPASSSSKPSQQLQSSTSKPSAPKITKSKKAAADKLESVLKSRFGKLDKLLTSSASKKRKSTDDQQTSSSKKSKKEEDSDASDQDDEEDSEDDYGDGRGYEVGDEDDDNNSEFDDDEDLLNSALGSKNEDGADGEDLDAMLSDLFKQNPLGNLNKKKEGKKDSKSASSNKEKQKRKLVSSAPVSSSTAEVVVFQETGRREPTGSKYDYKTFMSSDITKLTGDKKKPETPITKEEADQDREDDMHDRELMDLLKSSRLIDDIAASELTGKDRRAHLSSRLIELGAKPSKAPKAPFPMRLGMIKAEKDRSQKRLKEAKDMGLYHSSLRNQILAGGDKSKVEKMKEQQAGGKGRGGELKEVDGLGGRFKGGVLHVPKSVIEGKPKGVGGKEMGGGNGGVYKRKGGGGKKGGKKFKKR
ncbi:hypothetical protein HDV05_005437 [Chytridiales sp. JEL 0842]|nr:hypothetical protein HDV05_005437 [Chytridiales sp. JEL 0842]